MKKRDNSELWFNSDSTAELTQIIHPELKFTLFVYDKESVGSLMLVNDWYTGGIQSKDYAVIHFQAMEYRNLTMAYK